MSAAADTLQNPFEAAKTALIARISSLTPPRSLATFSHPAEFSAVAEHIRDVALILDEWLNAVGGEVAVNAPTYVDLRLFTGTFHAAVDGDAAYACDEVGVDLRELRRA